MADLDHMMIIDDDREEVTDQSTTRNKSHERASANEKIKFDDHEEEDAKDGEDSQHYKHTKKLIGHFKII